MDFNPVLSEIQGLSPEAKGALGMAGHVLPSATATSAVGAPSVLPPGTLLPHPDAGPPSGNIDMPSASPTLSMPSTAPSVIAPRGTIQGDTNERGRLLSTSSGISQIGSRIENSRLGEAHPLIGKLLGGLAQGAATIGDIGLSTVAPEVAINTPGTEYHHQALLNHASGALTQDEANAQKEAQAANENATAGKTNAETPEVVPEAQSRIALEGSQADEAEARTNQIKNPAATWEVHDTDAGPILYNKASGTAQHLSVDGQPVGPKLKLTESQPIMGPDGKPHTYMLDEKGNKAVDLGVHYERPQVTNINENHAFAEQERGRGLLDAAEKQYRTAEQGAETMRDMLASAEAGNKMSGQMLPLEGALAITTAQGVHRINRTEVDQFSGGGNLYDSVAGRLGKLTAGQPMDESLRKDVAKLTAIQEKAAYAIYKSAYDSSTKRYGLKDEEPLAEPNGGGSQHKVGDTVSLGGKQVTIKKINPDGTFDY